MSQEGSDKNPARTGRTDPTVSRGLAAVMAIDAVGSSRLMEQDSAAALQLISSHRTSVIEPTIQAYRGRVFKHTGDGALAVFASVIDAVECAAAMQEELGGKAISDAPLAYRIGIDLGDVLTESDDVYGEGVNIAARLEAKAPPGGVCLSQRVRDAVGQQLDIAFADGGEVRLKNLSRPLRIYTFYPRQAPEPGTALPGVTPTSQPSIAVLPFDDMSSNPEQAFFCDGITEDLITELARIPGLLVIARHSSFAYKGKAIDVRQIGHELGVRHLVEGSVRRAGDRVRITAQLVEVENGRHLWAERYDRDIQDVFAVQDEVVAHIAAALSDALGRPGLSPQQSAHPRNLEAYEWVVRGRQNVLRAQSHADAKAALEKAIEIDPELSDAHAWLAVYYYTDWFLYHREVERESLVRAYDAADRAIETGPDNSLAHMALGMVSLYSGRRALALESLHRALELNPNEADALCLIQDAYTFNGEPEKGVESVRKAIRLNPHHPEWYLWHLGFALYCTRDYAGAVEELSKLRDIAEPLRILAASHARLGHMDEAHAVAAHFLEAFPDFSSAAWGHTQPFRHKEDLEHCLEGYRLAGLPA